jgi:Ni,Fe-hydrogenase maturation factor
MTPPRPLPPHRESLKKRLRDATRVAVLAAGSSLRADDAAGMVAAEELDSLLKSHPARVETQIFLGETVPENLTGEIKRFTADGEVVKDVQVQIVKNGPFHYLGVVTDPDVITP